MQKERRKKRKKSINMVEIKLLSSGKDSATYVVKGTTPVYLNTIRRMILQRVLTLAIEDVTFVENGSALYDESVAHRMGLVPIVADLETYSLKSKCKCGGNGCARCELTFTIDKKGPGIVYAEDIKFADPSVKSAYPKMPVVKLLENQNMKAEGKATMGCGKQHMKFAPGTVYYRGYPEIKINTPAEVAIGQCPVGVFKKDSKTAKVEDETACILCGACEEHSPEGAITVKPSEEDFIVTVEAWGQIPIKEMVPAALSILDEELDELEESIKSLK